MLMIDIFIVVLLGWAVFSGWRNGLVKELLSSAGFLVGLLVAATCYSYLGKYLAVEGTESNMLTSVIAFFLLWIVVPIALGLVANVLTRAVRGMSLGMPNSILGALVSFLKFFLLISCVLNVMEALHIMNEEKTASSHLYRPVTESLRLFFPDNGGNADGDGGTTKSDTVWVDMTKKH